MRVCVPGELCQQPASQPECFSDSVVCELGGQARLRAGHLIVDGTPSLSLPLSLPKGLPSHPLQLFDRVWLTCILVDKEITWSLS